MTDRLEPALIALRQILRATEISSRALAKDCGLTPSQLILMQITEDTENPTPSFLAKKASLSQATVTALIDKLEKREFVRRRRDDLDKRRVYVELTEYGSKTLRQAPDSLQTRFEKGFAKLEPWEQSFLVAALERTTGLLDAEDLDAAPVLDVGAIGTPVE
ncbi:MAG: MarR family transcriptional regulator [Marinicaulis sp.]|nr:MarR family transcriptional regulator [Marinicaulis sp.]NNL90389.1 MarR family transcriptional regulator [Marinicaulis sp.]